MAIRLADPAPDFTAETTDRTIDLHEYPGDSWGMLFSHLADFTPVCTTELGELARRKGRLRRPRRQAPRAERGPDRRAPLIDSLQL